MKITRKEAEELRMLSDVIEIKKYDYHEFMSRSTDDTEIELSVYEFRTAVSYSDAFDSDTRDHY